MDMGVMKEHPRHRIVSVRISDEETQLLDQLRKETSKSVSEIMREAIRLAVPQMEASRVVALGQ